MVSTRLLFCIGFFLVGIGLENARAELRITEFLAINATGIVDEDASREDWLELTNISTVEIDLDGYALTDDPAHEETLQIPSRTLGAGESIVVFASGKDRFGVEGNLHTDFRLDGDGEYLALLGSLDDQVIHSVTFPRQYPDITYGTDADGNWGYLLFPTPGEANALRAVSVLEAPIASVERGLYDSPFRLVLSAPNSDADIYYTRDGSPPTADSLRYTEPISIDGTSVIRASAVLANHLPSGVSTWTYLFPEDVPFQERMDSRVTEDPTLPTSISESVRVIPMISICVEDDSFFGPNGIHTRFEERGIEVPVSMEWLNSSDSAPFQIDAGLRIHGGDARTHPKKPLRLHFRSDYGSRWLDHPIIPDSPVSRFRDLVLRGGGHDAWSEPRGNGVENSYAFHATYLRDAFVRQNERRMGLTPPEGEFSHLFINGVYWGFYQIQERPRAAQMAERLGGSEDEWDVMKSGDVIEEGVQRAELADGSREAWDALQAATDYEAIQHYLDMDRFIDSLISRMWAGDHDWLGPVFFQGFSTPTQSRNWYAVRHSRGSAQAPFHFFTWDAEISLGSNLFNFINPKRTLTLDLTQINAPDSPASLYQVLREDPRFRSRFGDRLAKHLSPGGALSTPSLQERWQALVDSIETPLFAESARWGDVHGSHAPYGPAHPWRSEVNWVSEQFLVERSEIFLQQCRVAGLNPGIDPPSFTPSFGSISGEDSIALESLEEENVIWYTLDGSDPQDPTSQALQYTSPIPPQKTTPWVLRARARTPLGEWSALASADYHVDSRPVKRGDLRIIQMLPDPIDVSPSEIASGFDDPSDFEFIEWQNVADESIQIGGSQFTNGITFTFPPHIFEAGERFVLARNPSAFGHRYGPVTFPVFGPYTGRLDNAGERLRMETSGGETIMQFSFETEAPWPSATREGHSLVFSPHADFHATPSSWRSSDMATGFFNEGAVGDSYEKWQVEHFVDAGSPEADAEADPDGDGVVNAVEYLFGTGPLQASSGIGLEVSPVTHIIGSAQLRYHELILTVVNGADTFPFIIEASEDLQEWRMADLDLVENRVTSSGENRLTYSSRLPIAADGGQGRHWRVKVLLD